MWWWPAPVMHPICNNPPRWPTPSAPTSIVRSGPDARSAGHRIQNHSDADNRTPKASCSRPVAANTGSRARPEASPETVLTGPTARGRARRGRRATARRCLVGGADRRQRPPHHGGEGHRYTGHVTPTGSAPPQPDGQGAFAGVGVGGDVSQVVGHQQCRRQQPHQHGGEPHYRLGPTGASGRSRCRRWPPVRRTRRRTPHPARRSRRVLGHRCRTSPRPDRPLRP